MKVIHRNIELNIKFIQGDWWNCVRRYLRRENLGEGLGKNIMPWR